MKRQHQYQLRIIWTGNTGTGTSEYSSYERAYEISSENKAAIAGSSDPAFRGDRTRWNPEELLVASLSACHQLWYLHLCAQAGIVILEYVDEPEGIMEELPDGSGRFVRVTPRPRVTIAVGGDPKKAKRSTKPLTPNVSLRTQRTFPLFASRLLADRRNRQS